MSLSAAPVMEEYHSVVSQLSAMEYTESLPLEALPLVKRLLADLILTTESHEAQHNQLEEVKAQMTSIKDEAFPLRRDNSRLVRENNQLHLEIIKRAEEFDTQEKQWRLEMVKQGELSQQSHFLREALLKKTTALEMYLQELTDKENHNKSNVANDVSAVLVNLRSLLKKPDSSIDEEGAAQIQKLKQELEISRKQVALRDEEIKRLSEKLEKPATIVSESRQGQVVTQLNSQVEFLTNQVSQYEQKLKSKEMMLKEANSKPPQDDSIAALVESFSSETARFKSTIHSLEADVLLKTNEVDSLTSSLESVRHELSVLQQSNTIQNEKETHATVELKECQEALTKLQKENLELNKALSSAESKLAVLNSAVNEKGTEFQDKVDRLQSVESELQRLKVEYETALDERNKLEATKMEFGHVEEEMTTKLNLIQSERDSIQTALAKVKEEHKQSEAQVLRLKQNVQELEDLKLKNVDLTDEVEFLKNELTVQKEQLRKQGTQQESMESLPATIDELRKRINELTRKHSTLQGEYNKQNRLAEITKTNLQEKISELTMVKGSSLTMRKQIESLQNRERQLLENKEQLELDVLTLTEERDHFSKLYKDKAFHSQKQNGELSHQEMELEQLQRKLEKESDALLAETKKGHVLGSQLDNTKASLKQVEQKLVATTNSEKKLRVELRQLKIKLSEKEKSLHLLKNDVDIKESEKRDLHARAEDLQMHIHNERQKSLRQQKQLDKLKSLVSKIDGAREQLQHKLTHLHGKEETHQRELDELNQKLEESAERVRSEKQRSVLSEGKIEELKRKNELLRQQIDNAKLNQVKLRSAVNQQERKYKQLEQKLGVSTRMIETHVNALDTADADRESKQQQINILKKEVDQLKSLLKSRTEELGNSLSDLRSMTSESQRLSANVLSISAECEKLRAELSSLKIERSKSRGTAERETREKKEVLEVYRRACEENKRLKHLLHELSKSRSRAVSQEQSSQSDLSRLRQTVALQSSQMQKLRTDLEAYERQVGELSRLLHLSRSKVEAISEDAHAMQRDSQLARSAVEMNAKREETLRWELGEKTAEVRKLRIRIQNLQKQNSLLEADLLRQKRRYHDLELVAARARSSEAQAMVEKKDLMDSFSSSVRRNTPRDMSLSASSKSSAFRDNEKTSPAGSSHSQLRAAQQTPDKSVSEGSKGSNRVSASGSSGTGSTDFEKECLELEEMINEQSGVIKKLEEEHQDMSKITISIANNLQQM